ncbi:MAG TPA: glycosyl hydrolase 115 family protein [Terriglobales bacterium]|nr:glycosyl hydrolase 115 family protein [Terriglobales bacterium]
MSTLLRLVLVITITSFSAMAAPQAPGNAEVPSKPGARRLLTVDGSVSIVESADAPEPIRHAIEDLAADFQTVTGRKPKVLTQREGATGTTILVGTQAELPEAMRTASISMPESFSMVVREGTATPKIIVLSGPDIRGTMYAVYEFSQEFLGIDPLYYWTDRQPTRRTSIQIPLPLNRTFPAPVFKYRGFFINDEDLLTGWAPGEAKDKTGISLAVWNKIYETTLRLKGNMIAPGTWIFPDDPQVKLAATRGLIVTQHHAIPLGLNVARWPRDVPYNYTEHPEILERAWKDAVNSYLPNQEVLWSVGLRGLSDVTYASMDPSVRDNNKALGQLISKAIADQISIVRAVRPNAKFVTNLWQEGARLVQQGNLKIPPEVTTVWADDGYGWLQDHGEVTTGQGAYDHVAMMNGRANQLTEMVPIERSLSEIGRYIKAGATQYYLVNTSDIRPVTMSIRAVMDAVWSGLPTTASSDGIRADPAGTFYQKWTNEEFGKQAAAKVTDLYREYFAAPAHFGEPIHEFGDQLYHTEARRMILTYMIDSPIYALPSQAPKWEAARFLRYAYGPNPPSAQEWLPEAIKRDIQQCGDAQPRWDAVWKKALAIEPLIPAGRRPFYDSEVLAMISINRESNRILYLVARGIHDAQEGKKAQARQEIAQALAAFDEIQRTESAAEYGKWKNWYRGDWLTGIYRTREIVQTLAKYLDDPLTHIAPPVVWDGWEAYYHIMHYEGDREADVK